MATCFASLDETMLREQGDLWAGAVVQRAHGGIPPFTSIAAAVRAEVNRTPIPMGRDESSPMDPKPMPVMYCAEIIDAPEVRAAIDEASSELRHAYDTR